MTQPGSFNIETTGLGQQSQNFEATHGILAAKLNAVVNETDDLIPKSWQGAAADAFKQFIAAYADGARKMNDQLLEASRSLQTSSVKFSSNDADAASGLSGVTSSLTLPPN